jgi:hypothetical protein
MKKPVGGESDKPRALTEEPKDEFRKLEQQYDNASIEERDRLWPPFIRAVREKYPGRMAAARALLSPRRARSAF